MGSVLLAFVSAGVVVGVVVSDYDELSVSVEVASVVVVS
jgi:hypothetical protein